MLTSIWKGYGGRLPEGLVARNKNILTKFIFVSYGNCISRRMVVQILCCVRLKMHGDKIWKSANETMF